MVERGRAGRTDRDDFYNEGHPQSNSNIDYSVGASSEAIDIDAPLNEEEDSRVGERRARRMVGRPPKIIEGRKSCTLWGRMDFPCITPEHYPDTVKVVRQYREGEPIGNRVFAEGVEGLIIDLPTENINAYLDSIQVLGLNNPCVGEVRNVLARHREKLRTTKDKVVSVPDENEESVDVPFLLKDLTEDETNRLQVLLKMTSNQREIT